ncbi:MAG: C1 family peptidase [Flavobacteriales bacterium]|nr:C1 family peptidase [Flavobacteriales bacterium]MCB9193773.1 C1 family peptidase [Flavobacteriales bacterium]
MATLALGQSDIHPTGVLPANREALDSITVEIPFRMPRHARIPPVVDLSPWFPAAGDQGRQNACSGWALGYALTTYHRNRLSDRRMRDRGEMPGDRTGSAGFFYQIVLMREGQQDCSTGVHLEDAIHAVCEVGCCDATYYPPDTASTRCFRPIGQVMLDDALRHRLSCPIMIAPDDPMQWKYHLSFGRPVVFQMSIDSTFHDGSRTKGREVFTWRPKRPLTMDAWAGFRGHILTCAGYDDVDSTLLVLNSWGQDWGQAGYFRLPYSVLSWACTEAYVLADMPIPMLVPLPSPNSGKDLELGGSGVRTTVKEDVVYTADGITFRLVDEHAADDHVLIVINDPDGGDGRYVRLRRDQPLMVHSGPTEYALTLDGRTWLSRRPRITVEKDRPDQLAFRKAFLDRVTQRSGEVKDGR